jgi:hypothetical protein
MRSLVLGDRFVQHLSSLSEPGRQSSRIVGLSDKKYDVRHVEHYLHFDVIISPYRLCLMHLALSRQGSPRSPHLILATDARHHTDRLIDGRVCDDIVDSDTGARLIGQLVANEPTDPRPEKDRRIAEPKGHEDGVTAEAFVQFMAYLGRGAHGWRWWSKPSTHEDAVDEYQFWAMHLSARLKHFDWLAEHFGHRSERLATTRTQLQSELAACRDKRFLSDPKHLEHFQQRDFGPGWERRDADGMPEVPPVKLETAFRYATKYYEYKCEKNMTRHNLLTVAPVFGRPSTIKDPTAVDRAFMLMPFESTLTRVYNDIIRPTVEGCGVTLTRADDFFRVGEVMKDVWIRLNEADFIIADVTGRNPNVFYELGICHTLGKPVIILTQDIEDVPFDIRHLRVIVYNTQYDRIPDLTNHLSKAVGTLRLELEQERGFS